jgi:2-dehydropantoate 2-reductase
VSVAVIGPGAMGCLLAASLAEGGVDVVLVDRDAQRAARLTHSGLEVLGPREGPPRRVSLRVGASLAAEDTVEVAFLCVKTGATEAGLSHLAGHPQVTVAVLQNGCERSRAVGEILGNEERVVGVLTAQGATLRGEGRVLHAGQGATQVGPLVAAGAQRAFAVQGLLARAGWKPELCSDLRRVSWEKLGVNAAINSLTGLLDVPNGALLTLGAAGGLGDAAADEVAALARDMGIPGAWEPDSARQRWRAVALHTAANISSTLQDVRRGRTTEVRAINGAVSRLARERGVPAPVNDVLARLVESLEQKSLAARASKRDTSPSGETHG